jgi:hypothetical protein
MPVLRHGCRKKKKKNALTFDTSQSFAMVSAVSAARFKSEEYMAAGLASLDSRRATFIVSSDFLFYISVNTRHRTANDKSALTCCLSKRTIPQRLAVYQSHSALGPSVPVEGCRVRSVSREFRFPETMAVNESMAESISEI